MTTIPSLATLRPFDKTQDMLCGRYIRVRESSLAATLQHLEAGFEHGAQEIVDVRLGGVELEHGDAAL